MGLNKKRIASLVVLSAATGFSMADVGVLDKYDCHKHQQTKQYHCHGDANNAKLGGLIVSAGARSQVWSVGNNSVYLLAGAGVTGEYTHMWYAVTASYYGKYLLTADLEANESVLQTGWDAGIKVGPGVGRIGTKHYVLAGWSGSTLTNSIDDTTAELGGYYVGVGTGYNWPAMSLDASVVYNDPTTANDYVESTQSESVAYDIGAQVSLGARF
ncbi:hypothetical protein QWZ13_01890 [Reinekea marina]|uniref:Outer membrane protein beta-barrel domain-containing protein n=1 Tax=Reinekea marina TaxID=1310421 RepID=A0ABV7WPH7_9GAMM|nr:hypothetical protein [Reinekea marina]MBU2864478.1 hypothetical protein [Reinekea forsetii]MDN3647657.1 hypothetical protein [Reinekea marina]